MFRGLERDGVLIHDREQELRIFMKELFILSRSLSQLFAAGSWNRVPVPGIPRFKKVSTMSASHEKKKQYDKDSFQMDPPGFTHMPRIVPLWFRLYGRMIP